MGSSGINAPEGIDLLGGVSAAEKIFPVELSDAAIEGSPEELPVNAPEGFDLLGRVSADEKIFPEKIFPVELSDAAIEGPPEELSGGVSSDQKCNKSCKKALNQVIKHHN